ncbi:hypothetical protein ABPG74_009167 [Tetrahymena malaccensis]
MDIQTTQIEQEIQDKEQTLLENPEKQQTTSSESIKCGKFQELRVQKPIPIANTLSKGPKLHGYNFYKSLGSPQYVCAPMVDQSELAFRMLCRKYGTTLAYTPMIHSKVLQDQGYGYLNSVFSTCEEDRPLFAQFCGNNPDALLAGARYVEDKCDAIDINFGCPQGIAKRGRYGSYLLSEPDTIVALVKKLHENLSIPVTCKIRILPNRLQTIELAKKIEAAGCSILTVHGRTKEQNKDTVGLCDWDIIKIIKEELSIPVFANGGIYTFEDVQKCLEYTGVDGVMSAESLLENPALFSGKVYDLDEIALDYLEFAEKYPTPHYFSKGHIFKFLHQGLQVHTDLRSKLANVKTIEEQKEIVLEMKKRREGMSKEEKFGWYTRYWDKMGVDKQKYNQGCENWQEAYQNTQTCCQSMEANENQHTEQQNKENQVENQEQKEEKQVQEQ